MEKNKTHWFVIGLHLYIYPPAPAVGDIEGLHNWTPHEIGILGTLRFRFCTGIWKYTAGHNDVSWFL